MNATIVTIGNELLAGRILDSNFAFLARTLAGVGVRVRRHLTVGDEVPAIVAALESALEESELVVASGGLGPTADDVTREALAALAGTRLAEDPEVAARLADRYARLGRPFTAVARRQALLPVGVEKLPNPAGLAPGLWLERAGRVVCALPGVPHELETIARESLLPRLAARAGARPLPTATLRTLGLPEGDLAERIERDAIDLAGVELGYLPHAGGVDLRIVSPSGDPAAVARVEAVLAARFAGAIYGRGEETIEEVVNALLRARGLRLALAESCTGGLVGARVTRVPGSSDVFVGGVVAYSNSIKESMLGVPAALLAEHGAVSAKLAVAMAEGALARFGADVALAVTGVAGPGGGTPEKPVGRVFIGLARRGAASASRRFQLPGDRDWVRERAAALALECLRRFLLGALAGSGTGLFPAGG
jgi:nicotinamide-nucleotide amidase